MKRFIKYSLCIVLVLSLILNIGCKKENNNPDKEANIGNGIEVFMPQTVTDDKITASNINETKITAQEEKSLWSYKYLNDDEKRVYRIMLTMVKNLSEGWANVGHLGKNSSVIVAKSFRALSNDFPEYYWMPSSYYINLNDGQTFVSFKKNSVEDSYGYTKDEVSFNADEFSDAILRIIEKTHKATTPFEKEVIIHDQLCKYVTYDSEFKGQEESDLYSAFGALVYGRAVCEGYARAFKLLCKYAGIECILVTGDSKGVGHMWNMVNIEDNWYHVDVTWDDLREKPLHTYLNVTEFYIRADHDIDITYSNADSSLIANGNSYNFSLPEAKSDELNFYKKRGLILSDNPVETFANALIKSYKNGETYAELLFENSDCQKDFKENYETYVVEIQKKCIEKQGKMKFKLQTISFPSNTCVIYITS